MHYISWHNGHWVQCFGTRIHKLKRIAIIINYHDIMYLGLRIPTVCKPLEHWSGCSSSSHHRWFPIDYQGTLQAVLQTESPHSQVLSHHPYIDLYKSFCYSENILVMDFIGHNRLPSLDKINKLCLVVCFSGWVNNFTLLSLVFGKHAVYPSTCCCY